jgi:signal peptidase I
LTDSDRPVAPAAGGAPNAGDAPAPAAPAAADASQDAEAEAALSAFGASAALKAGVATGSVAEGTDWWGEVKAIFWLILAVLAFHSFIAKPFYIPSESMMPSLLKGDRLVVSKYPYGWSWVSPSFHILPETGGRLFGSLPERGDIVIVTPPGQRSDYIKRVIGLPGDSIQMIAGQLYINGQRVRRESRPDAMIPMDANVDCKFGAGARVETGADGRRYCRLPIFRETLPNGRSYNVAETTEAGSDFAPRVVPAGHLWLMGDNRDHSADSRVPLEQQGLGGPVPWENIGGRAEFITFSLDGSSSYLNPISWFTALRGGRAGTSLHPEEAAPAR